LVILDSLPAIHLTPSDNL